MIRIKKYKNDMNTCNFELSEMGKTLKIMFAPNFDLYMSLGNGQLIPYDSNISLSFDITKENMEIFRLFDSLYKDIVLGNIFSDTNYLGDFTQSYEYSILVDQNCNVNWVSDDGPIEVEDSLSVSRIDEDTYRLTFSRNDKPMDFGFKSSHNITVRFRNSGSRYNPFNCVFMRMFHELQSIDPDYHQIHFEEIEYVKRLTKKQI